MTPEIAETTALNVLGWLVTNDELLPVFMGATGIDQEALRQQAGAPDFMGSVLDFVLMDDAWVIQACDALKLPYETLGRARQLLPGGAQVHWT
ncbi:DUF3572 domain-containing protein [Aliiroseovarius sp. CAU 1755]